MDINSLELILSNHEDKLIELLNSTKSELVIVSPWIKQKAVNVVINFIKDRSVRLRIYTRFNLEDIKRGSSDLKAIVDLLKYFRSSEIRFIPNLHAKIYISDKKRAIITSSNLTTGGMQTNVEAGIFLIDSGLVPNLEKSIRQQLDSALLLNKDTFTQFLEKIEQETTKKAVIKTEQKEHKNNSNIVLGKYIKPIKQDKDIDQINKELRIKIDLVQSAEHELSHSEKIELDYKELGTMMMQKALIKYPDLINIKPEFLASAFIHSSSKNLVKQNFLYPSQVRLTQLGRFLVGNLI
ncbi:phospholipase D family protein [Patescibacteria group bacterium]|nr:phospholipase D family protein [Patescibacteria group bacterium]